MADPVSDPGTSTETPVHEQTFDPAVHVPEAIRGEKFFENFKGKNVGDVMKSAAEAHKMVGGSFRIPADDAPPEEWEKTFYSKTRPKEYNVTFNDKVEWSDDGKKSWTDAMSQVGLTKTQAQKMFDTYAEQYVAHTASEDVAHQVQKQKEVQELRDHYKGDFDLVIGRANRAVKHFGGEELEKEIKELDLSRSPALIKAFAKIADTMTEDSFVPGATPRAMSKEEANNKLSNLRATDAFKNEYDPGHKAAVSEQDRLFRILSEHK